MEVCIDVCARALVEGGAGDPRAPSPPHLVGTAMNHAWKGFDGVIDAALNSFSAAVREATKCAEGEEARCSAMEGEGGRCHGRPLAAGQV